MSTPPLPPPMYGEVLYIRYSTEKVIETAEKDEKINKTTTYVCIYIIRPVYYRRTILALSPSSNSDPGSHGRPSSPLPTTVCAFSFYRENNISIFFPRRLASNCAYVVYQVWKKRNERPNVGGIYVRNMNGAPSRKGRVVK